MGRRSTLLTRSAVCLCLDGWRPIRWKDDVTVGRGPRQAADMKGCSWQRQVAFLWPGGLSDFCLVIFVPQSHHLFDTPVIIFSCLFILMVSLKAISTNARHWICLQIWTLVWSVMNDACNNKIVNNFSEDTVELHVLFSVVRRYNAKFSHS